MAAVASPLHGARIVGALACQQNSYLRSLETEVVSCVLKQPSASSTDGKQKSSKDKCSHPSSENGTEASDPKLWLIECADSVLFPEGGGQPSDHGTLLPLTEESTKPIAINHVQRDGLRCVQFSSEPLSPGTKVLQQVDFKRRWDHMQQHTGQHLLSAVMNRYENLKTLSWSMGAAGEMNYVELPRKPSADEIRSIQDECNKIIGESLSISVQVANDSDSSKLPGDYDKDKGVVRVVKIGNLDNNTCCGTHLSQTSHISLILLHHTQSIRGTNCRLFFTAGDRAVQLATASITGLRNIAQLLSVAPNPPDVVAGVTRLNDNATQLKRNEAKLFADLAKLEAKHAKSVLEKENQVLIYHPDGGMDYFKTIMSELKDDITENKAVILLSGQDKKAGQLLIVGDTKAVAGFVQKAQDCFTGVKGGGKGERWQGKINEFRTAEFESFKKAIEG